MVEVVKALKDIFLGKVEKDDEPRTSGITISSLERFLDNYKTIFDDLRNENSDVEYHVLLGRVFDLQLEIPYSYYKQLGWEDPKFLSAIVASTSFFMEARNKKED